MPITVLLTDDKEAVRNSIRMLLESDPEIRIVGEAANFQQTIQSATDLKPQIVVMDLHHARRLIRESSGNQITAKHVRVAVDCNLFLERRGYAGARRESWSGDVAG